MGERPREPWWSKNRGQTGLVRSFALRTSQPPFEQQAQTVLDTEWVVDKNAGVDKTADEAMTFCLLRQGPNG